MSFTELEIRKKLNQNLKPNQLPESPYPEEFFKGRLLPAAVLIPFLESEGKWHLLFIRRTFQKNDRHRGQVAFPGGRCDPGDPDPVSTALREANEETGIIPDDVQILGRLQDLTTITGYQVSPIVGKIPWPYELNPQPAEVDRIFTIPLTWLANPANREVRNRNIQVIGEPIPVIYFRSYDGETLWGASARITMLLLETLGFSDPNFRYKIPQTDP